MSNTLKDLTVISGGTTSDEIELGNGLQGGCLTRVETPSTLDSTSMTISVSIDGGSTFKTSSGAAITIAANKSYYIDPLYTRGATHAKIVLGTAETTGGTNRTLRCVAEYRS